MGRSNRKRYGFLFAGCFLFSTPAVADPSWKEVNLGWRRYCGSVEIGNGKTDFVFRTHQNCWVDPSTSIFSQRSEIVSKDIPASYAGDFLISTRLSFRANTGEPAIIFQIHDGRKGCSPPLSVRWLQNGTLRFDSDHTRAKGLKGCEENTILRAARYLGPTLRRDGTPYEFDSYISMDGKGGFRVEIHINGKTVIGGEYKQPSELGFIKSKRFQFRHGVYSQDVFDYQLRSSGFASLNASNGTHIFTYSGLTREERITGETKANDQIRSLDNALICAFSLDDTLSVFSKLDSRQKYVDLAKLKGLDPSTCRVLLSK